MIIATFNMSEEDLTAFANQVKDILGDALDLPALDDYVVTVTKPNIFGRAYNKVTGKDAKDRAVIRLLKACKDISKSGTADKLHSVT